MTQGINFVLPEPPLVDSDLLGPLYADDTVQQYDFSLNTEDPIHQVTIQVAGNTSNAVRIYLARRGSPPPSLDGLLAKGIFLAPCSVHSRWLVAAISALNWTIYFTNATPGDNALLSLSIDHFSGLPGGS